MERRSGSAAHCQNGTELFQWVASGSNPATPTKYSGLTLIFHNYLQLL
jgi:hypothetical protein